MTQYDDAKNRKLTLIDRWEIGLDHHKKSIELMTFLKEHDFKDYGNFFEWNTGGDGDNGETLMYQMDAFFELKDIVNA